MRVRRVANIGSCDYNNPNGKFQSVMMKLKIRPGAILFSILGAALAWKAALLVLDCVPFNADEAVVALMARHILQGERPIFFYGQAYMGSLDAYLVAGFFACWANRSG